MKGVRYFKPKSSKKFGFFIRSKIARLKVNFLKAPKRRWNFSRRQFTGLTRKTPNIQNLNLKFHQINFQKIQNSKNLEKTLSFIEANKVTVIDNICRLSRTERTQLKMAINWEKCRKILFEEMMGMALLILLRGQQQ